MSTNIISDITAQTIGFTVRLVIMSVSTFEIVVILYIYYKHTIFRFILSTGNSEFLLYTHSLSLHVYYCFLYRLFGVPVEYDEYGHRPPEDGDDNENIDDGMLLKYLQSLSKI